MAKENIAPDLAGLRVQIETLVPMEGNPRRGDVDAVVKSYKAFGQRKPVVARRVVDEAGNVWGEVIAGNHQLAAAQKLGWKEIAVVMVDDDDLTAKAFALADNRTSDLGEYDAETLSSVLESMKATPDLLIAAGYNPKDLDDPVREQREKDASAESVKKNDRKTPTLDELAEKYASRENRTFMAELPTAVFVFAQDAVDGYAEEHDIESRADAFMAILRTAIAKAGL